MKKLSVIIPTLNEADCIQHTLNHLQPVRDRGHEIILVDGGSDDNTLAMTTGLVDITTRSDKGRAMQMNTGAKRASGDILLFLHADTLLPVNADKILIEAGNKKTDFWGRFDVHFNDPLWMFTLIASFMNGRSRLTGIVTGDQAVFVSRNLFQLCGGFPVQPLMEDIELSRRLRRRQRPLCLQARAIISSRRWRRHGIFRTVLLMWWLRLAYFCGVDARKLAGFYADK